MKKLSVIIIALLILCVFSTPAALSARLVSEIRDLGIFHSVRMSGSGNLYITQGQPAGLRIEASKRVLQILQTEVINDVLVIKMKPHTFPIEKLNVYATMPEVKQLETNGSVAVIGQSQIVSNKLELTSRGSGSIDLEVNVKELETSTSGSGRVTLKGSALTHDFEASGSSDLSGFSLATEKTSIQISGSGKAEVFVSVELAAEVNGSGKIYYQGSPRINKVKISGSGQIEKVE